MTTSTPHPASLADVYARALDARDPRFDGVFFVGITTTRVYCRPVCPARVSYQSHRRFFNTAAAAERAGFRPCLRCRPELAPGLAVMDAVPRLAQAAAQRIGAGALNGRSVSQLAEEFGVSERHLRRAMEREIGVSPLELAQTHRLLLSKRLLMDTNLPVTQIAFASGFQSLRRFNAAFRDQYRMAPSRLRRSGYSRRPLSATLPGESLRLTLAYRPPLAWDSLLWMFRQERATTVELVGETRYGRTIRIGDRTGFIVAEPAPQSQLAIEISASLIPALMPLIARLRRLFDLDADPSAVDAHLAQGGLAILVQKRPGIRIPGAMEGFEIVLRGFLAGGHASPDQGNPLLDRVSAEFGEPIETGIPGLTRLLPTASRIAEAGVEGLTTVGLPPRRATALATIAQQVADGTLCLEPGADLDLTRQALLTIDGVGEQVTTAILMRALYWPDAFPARDLGLQRALNLASSNALLARAEAWRPWRAYAMLHLWLRDALQL